jgi:hypothetical protein
LPRHGLKTCATHKLYLNKQGGRRGAFPPYGLCNKDTILPEHLPTAGLLGVSRVTLWKRLKEHNIQGESVGRG